jgi:hypothetical protein
MLSIVAETFAAQGRVDPASDGVATKFIPIDLSHYFNTSVADFPRPFMRGPASESDPGADGLARLPRGRQDFWGIPFLLGPDGASSKSWLVVNATARGWGAPSAEVQLDQKAQFLCFAQFCDWGEAVQPATIDTVENLGEHIADAVLIHEDGTEQRHPIRRRFEIQTPLIPLGQWCFAAVPHQRHAPTRLTDPLRAGTAWGPLQTGVRSDALFGPILWLWALPNAHPEKVIRVVRLESKSRCGLVVCGLTMSAAEDHPLRYERLSVYRLTLPDTSGTSERWKVRVDLGVVARSYRLRDFLPDEWIEAPLRGFGQRTTATWDPRHLYVEITASRAATLSLHDTETGKVYDFDLRRVVPGEGLEGRPQGSRITAVDRGKVWVQGRVLEGATRLPTPVRLAFRSVEGRYIPPYGHRTEINTGWFQDYGADVRLQEASFAYVDGTFQVELPVGEVLVEISKGFEYQPVRRRLRIEPGQRELTLEISRDQDLRSKGWVTADTHVHFLSPSTALLEAQAEGLNVINLLAAQLGDLFANVGDISHGPLTSRDGEAIVWIGTENRQHMLGHVSLLGVRGAPVFPMSAGGPDESYLGDPLWSSIAEWAQTARRDDGLAIAAHFGVPLGEIAADVVLGHIDAVELLPRGDVFNEFRFLEWYRYLNCGYRLAVVGGTDKMGAAMPAGANRTYAYLEGQEFSYANWAGAVRRGNTFATSGPLLLFEADGRRPGSEISLGSTGGTVEVQAYASSIAPIHRLEIVLNGRVVAAREDPRGSRTLTLSEKIRLSGPGWLAARCGSRMQSAPFPLTAHTSPVYVATTGRELFSAPVAEYLLKLVDGADLWVETLATRPDEARLARVRAVFEHARTHLRGRLDHHGIRR